MTNHFKIYDNQQNKPHIDDFDGNFDQIIRFDQFETPEIPANLLPSFIGDYAHDISDILSVPCALPVLASLGILSTSVSKKFVVTPKADWREPVNIYTAIALPPGSNKSLTLKRLIAPIECWEKDQFKKVSPVREKAKSELNVITLKKKRLEAIIKKPSEEEKTRQKTIEELVKLEDGLRELQQSIPAVPKMYSNNITPEALEQCVHEQDGRYAVITDEGGVLETLSGLYNSGKANVDILLKGIDGGSVRIKRKDREYNINPYLSLALVVQPQIFMNMANNRSFAGNGSLERFLYALPVSNVGYRDITDRVLCDRKKEAYERCVYNLLCIETPETPHELTLSPQAKILWDEYRKELETELRPNGRLYICAGWGAKLAGYTLRISGLLHIAEKCEHSIKNIIDESTMRNAITMAKLLSEHAIASFGLMGIEQHVRDAKELFEWLKTQHVAKLSKSQIMHGVRNREIGKKDRLNKAIKELINRNVLSRLHVDTSTRKPTNVYFINPEIF